MTGVTESLNKVASKIGKAVSKWRAQTASPRQIAALATDLALIKGKPTGAGFGRCYEGDGLTISTGGGGSTGENSVSITHDGQRVFHQVTCSTDPHRKSEIAKALDWRLKLRAAHRGLKAE